MQISAVLITTMMETLLFIVAVHGVVVGVSRWMSWPWVPTFGPQRWKWGANRAF